MSEHCSWSLVEFKRFNLSSLSDVSLFAQRMLLDAGADPAIGDMYDPRVVQDVAGSLPCSPESGRTWWWEQEVVPFQGGG